MGKTNNQGQNICSNCLQCCQNGDVKQLVNLLNSGCKVNARALDGSTPLIVAASHGHKLIVDALLSRNANVNSQDINGNTALMLACKAGHWKCVQSLLYSWSADLDKKDDTGSTALILTTSSLLSVGHLRCIKYLVEQDADLNVMNHMAMTALMYCVDSPDFGLPALKILIDAGADVETIHPSGESLLIQAVRQRNIPVVQFLLTLPAVDIHYKDKASENALMVALSLWSDNSQIVESLLKAGSDPNSISACGCTALNVAAASGFETTRLLLSNGAIPKLSSIYVKRKCDMLTLSSLLGCGSIFSPIDVAVLNGNYSTANFLLTFIGCRPYPLFSSYCMIPLNQQSEFSEHLVIAMNEMMMKARECKGWIEKARCLMSVPNSLKQLCMSCISKMLGTFPGRRKRLTLAGLPPSLVKLVMLDVDEQDFII